MKQPAPAAATAEEMRLRETTPVFVNSFEQLTYLRDTVDWFHGNGFRHITVLEQGSLFAPLTAYFASPDFGSRAGLRPLGKNIGPRRAVRKSSAIAGAGNPFIFTDPDLELPTPIAPDFLTRMFLLGRRYQVAKIGLALDISDVEKINLGARVGARHTIRSYYRRFFRNKLERNVWGTNTDTTFFLHVPHAHLPDFGILSSQPRISGVRVGGPGFVAGHRPWYFDNGMTAEEEAHYRGRTSIASTYFGRAA